MTTMPTTLETGRADSGAIYVRNGSVYESTHSSVGGKIAVWADEINLTPVAEPTRPSEYEGDIEHALMVQHNPQKALAALSELVAIDWSKHPERYHVPRIIRDFTGHDGQRDLTQYMDEFLAADIIG